MNTATTRTTAEEARKNKSHLLINRDFGLLFVGQAISQLGDQISNYTIILWIVTIIVPGQSWAPLAISLALMAAALPVLIVGPLAGVFVDRWNHRWTMLMMDAIRAVLALVLIASTGVISLPFLVHGKPSSVVQFGIICSITFLSSACAQFFNPAAIGLIGTIVPDEHRPHASALSQSIQAFTTIIGPPLAAPLLFTLGIQWALIVNFLSYLVSLLTLWAIHSAMTSPQPSAESSIRSEFVAGLRFSFSNQTIRMLIIASAIASLGIGAFEAMAVFFMQQNLHTDVKLLGVISASLATGTIVSALFAGKLCRYLGLQRTFYMSLLGMGILLVVFSRLVNFEIALATIFLTGIVLALFRAAVAPILLKETPKDMIGRVVAVLTPSSTLTSLLSIAIAGFLAGVILAGFHIHTLGIVFGPIDTIYTGVGCMFLLAALYAYRVITKKNSS